MMDEYDALCSKCVPQEISITAPGKHPRLIIKIQKREREREGGKEMNEDNDGSRGDVISVHGTSPT